MSVIWHELECGSYTVDFSLWRELAEQQGDPILDIGAGTGRISLDLARHGHRVTGLDIDPELIDELRERAEGTSADAILGDACEFDLGQRFSLCIVPMQTIQLLGGIEPRARFLRCAREHLVAGGMLAAAISHTLELYEVFDDAASPLPDICELDGIVYSSQPTAVRADRDGFVLERRRDMVTADGTRTTSDDVIRLDRLTAGQLELEGVDAGFARAGIRTIDATRDYVGSEVVILTA